MRLGTLLLRDGVISLAQLEAALRSQVIYGGRLGTNLVELDFIDLDTLASYLSRVLEIPLATQAHFEKSPADALDALGPGLADFYTAVPLGFEEDLGERFLAIALADPTSRHTLEKLETQTGLRVRAYCSPELRLFYYLEKHYNLVRKARFVRSGSARRAGTSSDERRRTQPAHGLEAPPSVLLTPQAPGEAEAAPPARRPVALSLQDACTRIDRARERDEIGEAMMEFARGRFGVAVMFLLRDQNALGWCVHSDDSVGVQESVAELSLPLASSSVLQQAFDSGELYRGPSPSAGQTVERRLWEACGQSVKPGEMLVVPVVVNGRPVNLFYAHPSGADSLVDEYVAEARELCRRAGEAYLRLIKRTKVAPV